MNFLVVANFKSNLTEGQVKAWIAQVKPAPGMVVAPSFPHLHLFTDHHLCAQDVSPFPRGAYTGAVNAKQLKELGVSYCIVGHSERRRYFHETAMDIANKVKELVESGITPILCLEEKDLVPQFASLDQEYLNDCIYCFEPGDGLGGTTTASIEIINSVKNHLGQYVKNARFMYGGSVTLENLDPLLTLNLAGLLIATASLEPGNYLKIMEKVSHET